VKSEVLRAPKLYGKLYTPDSTLEDTIEEQSLKGRYLIIKEIIMLDKKLDTEKAKMLSWEEIKKGILELVKKEAIGDGDWTDNTNISNTSNELDNESIALFSFEERSSSEGSDWWTQTEYYSEKLGKAIIWNYDARDSWDTLDEFVDYIYGVNKDIADFEESITLKK
jgi:hypothetical protein